MNVDCYLGEIRIFGGNYAPMHWAFCDGSLLPIAGNEALFSLLGNAYGGNGTVQFALPDFRSRLVAGAGHGPGLTPRALGDRFGQEKVALGLEQIPNHNHPFGATRSMATDRNPKGNIFADTTSGTVFYEAESTTQNPTAFSSESILPTGTGEPHLNMMPFMGTNYIISLTGTYPERP